MKRFVFTLQRMLGFKRVLYEKERNTLAQMRSERLVIVRRRDETERQMLSEDAAFRQKAAGEGVGMDMVNSHAFHRRNAGALCKQLDGEIAAADAAIERQLEVVVALDKEVKSLEKLRESQWEEYIQDAVREENERILELVSGKFARQQAAAQQRGGEGVPGQY